VPLSPRRGVLVPNIEVIVDMPGTVIKLEKRPGDVVATGDLLLVIESMKMEVEIASTAAGRLHEYAVVVGDQVNDGDCIAIIQTA
jgi:biotin carboxyl carrier protein